MFVLQKSLNRVHLTSAMCWNGSERKQQSLVAAEIKKRVERFFLANGTLLTAVTLFKYLRQTLSSSNDDLLAVEQNLWQARVKW